MFGNFQFPFHFYLGNETRYGVSDVNMGSSFYFNHFLPTNLAERERENDLFNNRFQNCLKNCFNNLVNKNTVQPNHEKPGSPNLPTIKKYFWAALSITYRTNMLNIHVLYNVVVSSDNCQ